MPCAKKKSHLPTFKQALHYLDVLLAKNDDRATKLWNVLAALRGPDFQDPEAWNRKLTTTTHIRCAAFPKTARGVNGFFKRATFFRMRIAARKDEAQIVLSRANRYAGHFNGHIEAAAEALGLAVTREPLNEEKKV